MCQEYGCAMTLFRGVFGKAGMTLPSYSFQAQNVQQLMVGFVSGLQAVAVESPSVLRRTGMWLLVLVVVAAPLLHLRVINQVLPSNHNDLISRWAGVRATLNGQDPYSPTVTQQIEEIADNDPAEPFTYPATLVPLLAPFVQLPWPAFRLLFLLVLIPSLAWAVWLSMKMLRLHLPRADTVAVMLICLSTWPVVWGFRMQQLTMLVAVLLVLAWYLLSREQWVAAGIVLALATVKPQLVVLLLLWLSIWACLQRRWSFLAAVVMTELAMLAAADILVPGWFPHWLAALRGYEGSYGVFPLQMVLGNWIGLLFTVLLCSAAGLRLWKMRNCTSASEEFGEAIALLLALTVCTAQAIWLKVYNQTLLVPACLLLLLGRADQSARLAVSVGVVTRVCIIGTLAAVPVAVLGEMIGGPAGIWLHLPMLNQYLGPVAVGGLVLRRAAREKKPHFASTVQMEQCT